jgi:hypothetical protein
MVMPMAMPAHLRRRLLRAILNHRSRAGIAERHRLGALAGSRQNEQCADGSKAQNFRHVHFILLGFRDFTSAPNGLTGISRLAAAQVVE